MNSTTPDTDVWGDWFEREGLTGRFVLRIDFTDDRHGLVHCLQTSHPFTMEFATPAPVAGVRMFKPGRLVASGEGR